MIAGCATDCELYTLINMEDNYGSEDEGMENLEEVEEGFSDDSEGSQDY